MTIVVRIGAGTLAHDPDGHAMDFASIEDATNWAYLEGLYQGAQVEVAKAHGAQGEALDGWAKNGLYIGAVVEVWRHVLPVDGEFWQCSQALRVLFPGDACRCPG